MVAVSLKKKSSRRRHKGRAEDGIRDVERSRCFFFQAEDGIRDVERSRGLGDVYKRQGKYNLYLGASLNGMRLNKLYRQAISHEQILSELIPILKDFAENKQIEEHFGNFCLRRGYVRSTSKGIDFHD